MKVPPTPTSPKVRSKPSADELERLYRQDPGRLLLQPKKTPKLSPLTLFLSLIIGFLAGILGELVLNSYLLEGGGIFGGVFSSGVTTVQRTFRGDVGKKTENQLESVHDALVAIYPLHAATGTTADVYGPEEQRGTGIILTNDGWIVTDASVLTGGDSFVAVTSDRKVLLLEGRVDDPASTLVFFRMDGGNYPTTSFRDDPVTFGEPLYALAGGGRQIVDHVRSIQSEMHATRTNGALESSDTYGRYVRIHETLSDFYHGGPVIDNRGRATGVIIPLQENGTALLPIVAVDTALDNLLKNKKITRPTLGLNYIDIGLMPGIPSSLRFLRNNGALLAGTEDLSAIVKGSPAAGANLQSGDLLLRVDAQTIAEGVSLADIVLGYDPGTVVTLTYVRDGKEEEARVTLGERVSQ